MPERETLYRILEVDPAASPLVIQAAYRVLARIFHPDVEGDDEQMKRINHAWEVLGDPGRRAQYDIERAGRHPGPVGSSAPAAPAAPTTPSAPPAAGTRTADVHAAFAANAAGRGGSPRTGSTSAWSHAPSNASAPAPAPRRSEDHAGPPRGEPYGPVLRFGRYEGWTLGQVGRVDRPFLEWLRSAPAGRALRDDIDAVLRSTGIPGVDRRCYDSERQRVHAWAPGAPTKVR